MLNWNQDVCITINVLAVGPHPSSESLYPLNSLKAIKLINGTWRMRITQNLSLMQFLSHCLVSSLFFLFSFLQCQTSPVPQIPLFAIQADVVVMYFSFRDSIPFKYGSGSLFPPLAAQSCQHLFLQWTVGMLWLSKPIHGKRALLGSEVISRGSWDGVPKKRKASRM